MPTTQIATSVIKKLTDAGHIAYFAGGWVRDYLMQHPSDDIDIATSANVSQIQALFPKTIPVGIAFGIVIVVEEGCSFEVATFRKESGYLDGRRPTEITLASPEEDAQRRDFTINGMFWDPLKKELHDFVDGQKDLKKGIIRAIGDPHARFLEDRLRMMRAARYATRFNFPLDLATKQAVIDHAPSLLPAVAMERVWQEFKKMSAFGRFDAGLILLHELHLLQTIFPNLKNVTLVQLQQRLSALRSFPKNAPTMSAILELFPEQSLEETEELCDYLKLSRAEREIVQDLYHINQILRMPQEWQDKLENIEWAYAYAKSHSQTCIAIFAAHLPLEKRQSFLETHNKRRLSLEKAILRIQTNRPVVRAHHFMQEGIPPGKKMGILLKEAERININEGINDEKIIIHLLKNSQLWNN